MSLDKWHILGRGAIGLLWANGLTTEQKVVRLITRTSALTAIEREVKITAVTGQRSHIKLIEEGHQDNSPIDSLVAPLKAYDIVEAITAVKHRLHPNSLVILSHNGMGTIADIRLLLGENQPLLFATTTHGALLMNPYQVCHTGLGETKMGWLGDPRPAKDYSCLNHILPPVTWSEDINLVLWQKLAINCVINPLTAIEQCNNGQLAAPRFYQQINQLCQEISAVATANGIHLSPQTLRENCYQVINATANNYSSMNRDVAAGRKTEIDFITGYLLAQAKTAGIDVPANQTLYQQVKATLASSHPK